MTTAARKRARTLALRHHVEQRLKELASELSSLEQRAADKAAEAKSELKSAFMVGWMGAELKTAAVTLLELADILRPQPRSTSLRSTHAKQQ